MFAEKRVRPLSICNFGFWDNIKLFLKKKKHKWECPKNGKKISSPGNLKKR